MVVSYRRVDSPTRGRHLVAARKIEKYETVIVERPLLALQTTENRFHYNQVCLACHAFCGDAASALEYRRQRRLQVAETVHQESLSRDHGEHVVIPCRDGCGHIYCSEDCEADAWQAFHCFLCTGKRGEDDALVKFKSLAVEVNEILLLVAEWWVAQHTSDNPHEYTDFCMEPWWDVMLQADEDGLQQPGGFLKGHALSTSLRELCQEAAELLSRALVDTLIPPITAEDVAKRIGACEQNAMGIRQRHVLCRDIFDRAVRESNHEVIVDCLADAGFIGNRDDDDGDNLEQDEEWDYSVDEITQFLAELFMDEEGGVHDVSMQHSSEQQERDETGDDLDHLFPPLDGTAMYSTICKMNHSCDPNVIVLYRRTGWKRPLVAHAVALCDIQEGEELTISYIESSGGYQERQKALKSYGFTCRCSKCTLEQDEHTIDNPPVSSPLETESDDLFGIDSEDEGQSSGIDHGEKDMDHDNAEALFQGRLERLDTATNHMLFGSVPNLILNRVRTWVHSAIASITEALHNDYLTQSMLRRTGVGDKDFCMCVITGEELESYLFTLLKVEGSWKNLAHREAYWAGCVIAALGHAHVGAYLEAIQLVDKAIILGLPVHDSSLSDFYDFVRENSKSMAIGPYTGVRFRGENSIAPSLESDYAQLLRYPLNHTLDQTPSYEHFVASFLERSVAVKMSGMAGEWVATKKWRDVSSLAREHGHRIIPIELGSMMNVHGMTEELMPLRLFLEKIIIPSNNQGEWSLQDSVQNASSVGYLAQHPLLIQLPDLRDDLVSPHPSLCGPKGPSDVMVWFGSGGTRTALHYDSYDNLFVQIVGVKYLRLYDQSEHSKLYVSANSTVSKQGNMSALDCEREDLELHPLSAHAVYQDVILREGDALFIPAGTWHYVRSLSTSISVNYWF